MRANLICAVVMAVAMSSSPADAQTDAEVEQGARDAYEMAHTFSECVGYWTFWAEVEDALGNAASAENARAVGRGARLSAGYMLSMRHRLVSPDAPPRPYGSWDTFIDSLAEITATQMMAALEQGDTASIRQQATTCVAMGATAQEIVDQMRYESLDQQ